MFQKDAAGRIFVKCPLQNCGKLHLVKRNRDYKAKEQTRFRCSSCKTNWYATQEEKDAIIEAYSEPSQAQKRKLAKQAAQSGDKSGWMGRIFG